MRKSWLAKFIKLLFVLSTLIVCFLYLIGCLLPWISAEIFWPTALVGLLFPYLCFSIIVLVIFWVFINKKYSFFLIVILCLGLKQLNSLIAFNSNNSFVEEKQPNDIRVVSWNIGNMEGKMHEANAKKFRVEEIINFLLNQNADVICLQEFDDCKSCKSLGLVLKKYKYYYLPIWTVGPHKHKSGNVIFSKYPIIKKDSTSFEDGHNIIRCDIIVKTDTLSFFNTHLSSYKFSNEEFREIDETKTATNLEKKQQKKIAKKLRNTLKDHVKEVDVTKDFMTQSNYPKIFCADLNEVANSNTYWILRENMKDAFLEKGFGFGKTYNSLWPILRIDVIFLDHNFNVTQTVVKKTTVSDHNLVVTDISLKN
jgi:endonuclease/exonuclease/phosphatase family metal-dependent hydrolase